jgi:hypothetical protein
MSCGNITNVRIEPVNCSWAIEERSCLEAVADVASSLNNKYFFIYSGTGVKHHVWISTGAGVDPAPALSTPIPVVIAPNAAASAVASAVSAALDAHALFKSTVSGADVEVVAIVAADTLPTVDFNTGFSIVRLAEGGSIDLGLLEGDVSVTFEETLLSVTSHQTGVTPLADLRQGNISTVALTLKESSLALQKAMLARAAGGSYTPVAGDEVFGWGTSRQGLNTIVQSRRLVMHPVALADADYSRDLCFWKAYPMPENLTFSGENPETMSVTFKVYLDDNKPNEIKQFVRGNWNQTAFVP